MKSFKIGQTVRIVDNNAAKVFNLNTLGLIGLVFVVEELEDEELTGIEWGQCAIYQCWFIPPEACELVDECPGSKIKTPFQRVSEMNTAFGNPKGNPNNIDWQRVRNQCKNIGDEFCELLSALGLPQVYVSAIRDIQRINTNPRLFRDYEVDVTDVRDALADIHVFKDGALHMMGYDGDNDMADVVDGVMTRFIKDDDDKAATVAFHASKGVTEVYFEGEYPRMVMKSLVDQPDAPVGKFLKSVSYKNTAFRPAP